MKSQALFLAFISMAGVCDALGKAWFYKGKYIKGSMRRPQADSSAADCTAPDTKDKQRFYTSGAYLPTTESVITTRRTDFHLKWGKTLTSMAVHGHHVCEYPQDLGVLDKPSGLMY
jgi:hypothetical protein